MDSFWMNYRLMIATFLLTLMYWFGAFNNVLQVLLVLFFLLLGYTIMDMVSPPPKVIFTKDYNKGK